MTVAGVPVTAQAADGVLTVTAGRFDPAACGRRGPYPSALQAWDERRVTATTPVPRHGARPGEP